VIGERAPVLEMMTSHATCEYSHSFSERFIASRSTALTQRAVEVSNVATVTLRTAPSDSIDPLYE